MRTTDFAEVAMEIHEEGLRHTDEWLRMLGHRELGDAVRGSSCGGQQEPVMGQSAGQKCELTMRAGEGLEADRAKRGTTGTVEAWFQHNAP
jgi:hypothetical protein